MNENTSLSTSSKKKKKEKVGTQKSRPITQGEQTAPQGTLSRSQQLAKKRGTYEAPILPSSDAGRSARQVGADPRSLSGRTRGTYVEPAYKQDTGDGTELSLQQGGPMSPAVQQKAQQELQQQASLSKSGYKFADEPRNVTQTLSNLRALSRGQTPSELDLATQDTLEGAQRALGQTGTYENPLPTSLRGVDRMTYGNTDVYRKRNLIDGKQVTEFSDRANINTLFGGNPAALPAGARSVAGNGGGFDLDRVAAAPTELAQRSGLSASGAPRYNAPSGPNRMSHQEYKNFKTSFRGNMGNGRGLAGLDGMAAVAASDPNKYEEILSDVRAISREGGGRGYERYFTNKVKSLTSGYQDRVSAAQDKYKADRNAFESDREYNRKVAADQLDQDRFTFDQQKHRDDQLNRQIQFENDERKQAEVELNNFSDRQIKVANQNLSQLGDIYKDADNNIDPAKMSRGLLLHGEDIYTPASLPNMMAREQFVRQFGSRLDDSSGLGRWLVSIFAPSGQEHFTKDTVDTAIRKIRETQAAGKTSFQHGDLTVDINEFLGNGSFKQAYDAYNLPAKKHTTISSR